MMIEKCYVIRKRIFIKVVQKITQNKKVKNKQAKKIERKDKVKKRQKKNKLKAK